MGGFDRPPFAPNVGGALTIPHLPMWGFGRSIISRWAMAQASTTSILPKVPTASCHISRLCTRSVITAYGSRQTLNNLVVLFDSVVGKRPNFRAA